MQRKAKKKASAGLLLAPFRVEIDRVGRTLSILIGGATAIEEFSDVCAAVKAGGYRVEISGNKLSLGVYEGGAVEIIGGILNVGFILEN